MIIAILAWLGHLVGTLIAKFGLFIQKKLHLSLETTNMENADKGLNKIGDTKQKPVYCMGKWIAGFICICIGGTIQMILLAYADLVLLSTNMIAGIIFNTFLSIRYLGEKFEWKYDLTSFGLMGIGAIIIVLISDMEEKLFTPR